MPLAPGTKLSPYEILSPLGAGGMGEVYRARGHRSTRSALVAARLLTAMLIGFGLLVWLPAPFADPHKMINWAGNAQNLATTGAAWIGADFLSQKRSTSVGT